jgi:O6-methylguanine-DNA--protein-cysteine methyltransferase
VTHTAIIATLRDPEVMSAMGLCTACTPRTTWYRSDSTSYGPSRGIGPDAVRSQIGECLAGGRQGFDEPVATHGDEHQGRAWSLVPMIPYGETAT